MSERITAANLDEVIKKNTGRICRRTYGAYDRRETFGNCTQKRIQY